MWFGWGYQNQSLQALLGDCERTSSVSWLQPKETEQSWQPAIVSWGCWSIPQEIVLQLNATFKAAGNECACWIVGAFTTWKLAGCLSLLVFSMFHILDNTNLHSPFLTANGIPNWSTLFPFHYLYVLPGCPPFAGIALWAKKVIARTWTLMFQHLTASNKDGGHSRVSAAYTEHKTNHNRLYLCKFELWLVRIAFPRYDGPGSVCWSMSLTFRYTSFIFVSSRARMSPKLVRGPIHSQTMPIGEQIHPTAIMALA